MKCINIIFNPFLKLEFPDDKSSKYCNKKACCNINRCYFPAKSPKSKITATSFTIGEDIRKENVMPRGIPASTNPINNGTAEHEQNGVTIPSKAARILPINSFLLDKIRFVFSGGK